MPRFVRFGSASLLAALLLLAAGHAIAAETTVECGAFRDFVAPDSGTATSGSITFGLGGAPETIAPTATLVPPADSVLPSLAGGTPTCLSVVRDAGLITQLGFAPSGTISGSVTMVSDLFGSGFDAYVIADRLFAPVDQVLATEWEVALIKAAADGGVPLTITFSVDVATGFPTGFAASLELGGLVTAGPGDDMTIGAATLPASVIDPASKALLLDAASQGVMATVGVTGIGTIDPGSPEPVVSITLDVRVALPDTATSAPPMSVLTTLGLLLVAASLLTDRSRLARQSSSR